MPDPRDQDDHLPARQFGWWDMFVRPEDDPRAADGRFQGERATLVGHLRDQRLTLELKYAGLDAAAWPAARSCGPAAGADRRPDRPVASRNGRLLPGGAVDGLPDEVGMPVVPGVLLNDLH